MRRPRPLLLVPAVLAVAGFLVPPARADYNDLLVYLEDVGGKGKNFVSGFLAPRLDVKRVLELLKGHMAKPWPALRLPRLDPLDIEASDFDFEDRDIGRLRGHVKDMQVRGLAEFAADDLTLQPLALAASFNVSWARLDVNGSYSIRGNFAGRVPTDGRGIFDVSLLGARLWGRIQLGADQPTLYVRSLDLKMGLENSSGVIEGLHRDPQVAKILSETALELLPEALRCCAGPRLSARLSLSAREALNERLVQLRAASHSALTWARAAAAADRVLSLARPATVAPAAPDCDDPATDPQDPACAAARPASAPAPAPGGGGGGFLSST